MDTKTNFETTTGANQTLPTKMTASLRDIMMQFMLPNSNQVFNVIAKTDHGSHEVYFPQRHGTHT